MKQKHICKTLALVSTLTFIQGTAVFSRNSPIVEEPRPRIEVFSGLKKHGFNVLLLECSSDHSPLIRKAYSYFSGETTAGNSFIPNIKNELKKLYVGNFSESLIRLTRRAAELGMEVRCFDVPSCPLLHIKNLPSKMLLC